MHFDEMVLGYFIITEMYIHIPVQSPIGNFPRKIEHVTEYTGYIGILQQLLLMQYIA